MEIIVTYAGAEVSYVVTREAGEGIFLAKLKSYSGGDVFLPPELLVLMKAGEKWMGGPEDLELVKALGNAIDNRGES